VAWYAFISSAFCKTLARVRFVYAICPGSAVPGPPRIASCAAGNFTVAASNPCPATTTQQTAPSITVLFGPPMLQIQHNAAIVAYEPTVVVLPVAVY
jgi:hypothetical protein